MSEVANCSLPAPSGAGRACRRWLLALVCCLTLCRSSLPASAQEAGTELLTLKHGSVARVRFAHFGHQNWQKLPAPIQDAVLRAVIGKAFLYERPLDRKSPSPMPVFQPDWEMLLSTTDGQDLRLGFNASRMFDVTVAVDAARGLYVSRRYELPETDAAIVLDVLRRHLGRWQPPEAPPWAMEEATRWTEAGTKALAKRPSQHEEKSGGERAPDITRTGNGPARTPEDEQEPGKLLEEGEKSRPQTPSGVRQRDSIDAESPRQPGSPGDGVNRGKGDFENVPGPGVPSSEPE